MCFSRPRSVRFPTLDQNLAQALKGYGTGRTIWRGLQALEQPAHLGPESPTPCRGRVSEGGAPPCHAAPWAELSASLRWRPATIRSGVSGLSRSSSPQVIQCGLLPRCGKVFPARLVIDQVDDDVPRDRTPLLIRGLIPAIRFPVSSRDHENGFVSAMESFHGLCTTKQLHGFAIPAIRSWLPWCKAQRGQAEYDRLAALCINAGHSNRQQGFVCRGRAKVRCRRALRVQSSVH